MDGLKMVLEENCRTPISPTQGTQGDLRRDFVSFYSKAQLMRSAQRSAAGRTGEQASKQDALAHLEKDIVIDVECTFSLSQSFLLIGSFRVCSDLNFM